jgi:PAP2 superfamily
MGVEGWSESLNQMEKLQRHVSTALGRSRRPCRTACASRSCESSAPRRLSPSWSAFRCGSSTERSPPGCRSILGDAQFALFTMSYHGHSLAIGPFSLMAAPAEALGRVAPFVLMILAAAALAGWRPKRHGRIVLVLGLSVLVAIGINGQVKSAFGRTWPESWLGGNPSWIGDGVFGFFPFHGGSGWRSFPSGHTTIITTLATVLWRVWPEFRIVWVAMAAIVITGLIGGGSRRSRVRRTLRPRSGGRNRRAGARRGALAVVRGAGHRRGCFRGWQLNAGAPTPMADNRCACSGYFGGRLHTYQHRPASA